MAAPALPALEMGGDLEGADPMTPPEESLEPMQEELDPMFAADVNEAFPDLEDSQLIALQRAIRGLMASGGI
jgi:hypothetical protein